jgi:hypothetical protein
MIEKNYCVGNGALWDFWVVPHGGVYHLYYLQDERDEPAKNDRRWSIGHAVSDDLAHWRECGIALRACPELGIHGLATGGALTWLGGGIMAVTVCAGDRGASVPGIGEAPPRADYGIAFARSGDMHRWNFVGKPSLFPGEGLFEPLGAAGANPPGCYCFGDPWLYALPGDSRLHILLNTRLRRGDVRTRGAIAHTSTADLASFEALRPLVAPGIAMRLETPQLFEKNGRWYLIASCGDALLDPAFIAAARGRGNKAGNGEAGGGGDKAGNANGNGSVGGDSGRSGGGGEAGNASGNGGNGGGSGARGGGNGDRNSGSDKAGGGEAGNGEAGNGEAGDSSGLGAAAIVFTADSSDGPFALSGSWALFPGEGCYICKAIPEADSILTIRCTATQYPPKKGETGLSFPYAIEYPDDGGIRVIGRRAGRNDFCAKIS